MRYQNSNDGVSPKCFASFIRTHPNWPYDERDYYLSKLYQFLMVIFDETDRVFEPSGGANEVGVKIEG